MIERAFSVQGAGCRVQGVKFQREGLGVRGRVWVRNGVTHALHVRYTCVAHALHMRYTCLALTREYT